MEAGWAWTWGKRVKKPETTGCAVRELSQLWDGYHDSGGRTSKDLKFQLTMYLLGLRKLKIHLGSDRSRVAGSEILKRAKVKVRWWSSSALMLLSKLSWTPASFPSHRVAPPHSISESGLFPAPSVRVQGRGHRQHLGVPGCALSCESVFTHWLLSCLVTSFKLLLWGSSNTWPCCIPTYFFGSVPNQCRFCFCRPQSRCWDSTRWAWSDSVPAPWTLTLDIEHVSISWLIYDGLEDSDCCQFIFTLSILVSNSDCA